MSSLVEDAMTNVTASAATLKASKQSVKRVVRLTDREHVRESTMYFGEKGVVTHMSAYLPRIVISQPQRGPEELLLAPKEGKSTDVVIDQTHEECDGEDNESGQAESATQAAAKGTQEEPAAKGTQEEPAAKGAVGKRAERQTKKQKEGGNVVVQILWEIQEEVAIADILVALVAELLVNVNDARKRGDPVKNAWITVEPETGRITVRNDGNRMPVAVHCNADGTVNVEGKYDAEVAFGELRTSSNFSSVTGTSDVTTGGMNGVGATGVNFLASEFRVSMSDGEGTLEHIWKQGVPQGNPKIGSKKRKPFMEISFIPDMECLQLGTLPLSHATVAAILARCLELSALGNSSMPPGTRALRVFFNGVLLPFHSPRTHAEGFAAAAATKGAQLVERASLMQEEPATTVSTTTQQQQNVGDTTTTTVGHKKGSAEHYASDGWHIAVWPRGDAQPPIYSYVNGVATPLGGTHVEVVRSAIRAAFETELSKHGSFTSSGSAKFMLDNKLTEVLALYCAVELSERTPNGGVKRPTFTSQLKQSLATPRRAMVPPPPTEEPRFNSFALRVIRGLGLVDAVVAETQARAAAKTLREAKSVLSSSNSSRRNVEAIPKYISALQAGSKSKSRYCSLILTEGDSAAGLVGKSWSILGHESYGSYTLGGKIANVNSTKLCSGVDGDASTTATDGLSSVDVDKLLKNNRIRALIRILGLELEVRGGTICGKTYTNTANLNYDRVIIMVDQDDDGSHIKGLLLAFFARLFPSLFVLPRFLWEFITPLVRVRAAVRDEGEQQVGALLAEFFDEGSYLEWRSQNPRAPPGHYYKGLGSSTDEEGREYFSAAARYCRPLVWESEADTEAIRMAFSKGTGAAAGRRAFIGDGGNVVTEEQEGRRGVAAAAAPPRFKDITLLPTPSDFLKAAPVPRGRSIHEFVERDVKECARALNKRAIPSVMDGLKPSQRKILWTCYQRRMYGPAQQKKVAQLGSDAASLTGYHHAEESLSRAIIKLAQEYVGSNNVALLVPGGQFGSRQMNGDDAAAPRYPYTWLQSHMRAIFREADEELLERELEDGAPIEPRWFAPIVPWILVNGACGIGVGHATDIPPFSFEEVCARVRLVLSSSGFLEEPREETALHVLRSTEPLKPYIRGFKGSLEPKTVTETREDGSVETKVKGYTIRGIVSEEGRTDKIRRVLHVTELPIELSIDGFKAHLDELKLGLKRSEAVKKKRVKWAKQKGKEELLNDGGTEEREAPLVYEYWDEGDVENIHFRVELTEVADSLSLEQLRDSALGLTQSISMSKMKAFSPDGRHIRTFETAEEIIATFCAHRLPLYARRLAQEATALRQKLHIKTEKARFIRAVVAGHIQMHGRTSAVFETQLSAQGFKKLDGSYEHLRSIRIDALTAEKAETFEVAVLEARKELEVLEATAPASLWLHELNEAEAAVREYTARLIRKSASASATAAAAVAKSKAVTGAVKNKPLKEGVVGLPPKKKART